MNNNYRAAQVVVDMPPDTCSQIERNLFVQKYRGSYVDYDVHMDNFRELVKNEHNVKEELEDEFLQDPHTCQGCGAHTEETITQECTDEVGCAYMRNWNAKSTEMKS